MPNVQKTQKITPCLWFDSQAEQAAQFYTGIFSGSRIVQLTRYPDAGREVHGGVPGQVMVVTFELDGVQFTALNGGPLFKFNQAISLQVDCATQEAVDYYWNKLSDGGDASAQQCGWLKDRYGVSWQIVPHILPQLLADPDSDKAGRVMTAMLAMKKPDIARLQLAAGAA